MIYYLIDHSPKHKYLFHALKICILNLKCGFYTQSRIYHNFKTVTCGMYRNAPCFKGGESEKHGKSKADKPACE